MKAVTRNTIISLVAVLAIGGGIYYYKTNLMPAETVAQGDLLAPDGTISEAIVDDSNVDSSESIITPTANASDSIDDQRFNNAMKNARTAVASKDYKTAIKQYNLALKYHNADTVYAGLFTVYSAQGQWIDARNALDKAIALAPLNADYWRWKLVLLDEKTDASFEVLASVYDDAIRQVTTGYKVNVITQFARIAESNGRINAAISQWELAMKIVPSNKDMYQAEIDRLNSLK